MKSTLLLPVLLLSAACASTGDTCSGPPAADVDALAEALTGHFSSASQAAADEDYFDISLVMQPIWTERADGPWLYVEQAVATALERPYRQRVYHLVGLADGGLRSDVFTLPGDPLDFVAAWERPELFAGLTPADLEERVGCSIYLEALGGGAFAGATRGDGCGSSLGEAAYATSEVTLEPGVVRSWDRGWAADGTQAWGAEKGPYVFDRLAE